MKYPCRCNRCLARKSFRKHPDEYVRAKICICGGAFKVDWYRKNVERKVDPCHCDAYHFPHKFNKRICKSVVLPRESEDEAGRLGGICW